jgi:Immunoglobulin domain
VTRTSRILAVVSAGLLFGFAARGGQSVSLQWGASSSPAPAGYLVYYGAASHSYTSQINVGTNTVVTLSGLNAGQTYYFAVGGYDSAGVAGLLSNEASFVAPTNNTPAPPPAVPASVIVTPASGPAGTTVYIYGTNLSGAGSVSFNGLFASFTLVSNSVLAAVVPPDATTGPLDIVTPSGTIISQFTVTTAFSPVNDNFAYAQVLTGTAAFVSGTTTLATKQPGEPNHGGNTGGASVWYSWTAPASGLFSLSTAGSSFDTLLAVYTGSKVAQLSVVASNPAPVDVPLSFEAVQGVTYEIAVDGYNGASGLVQLQLSPLLSSTTVFFDSFEATEGVFSGKPLAGANGWLCAVPNLSGVAANYFPGYGQQGYLGFDSLALTNNTVLLYPPLNFAMNTNTLPVIQFSVLLQLYNPLNNFHDSFGWLFRNAGEQRLFSIMFNNATGQITYGLNDGAGQRSSGFTFSAASTAQLVVTADFSSNLWSATLNGAPIIAGQPITATNAALTLGDIDAQAIYPGLQSGADGMLFDNYTVTAEPESAPTIVLAPQSQTVTAGSSVMLGVIAGGASPLSYQWYYKGQTIPGAISPSLWLSNTVSTESGNYMVVVTNPAGSALATGKITISNPQAKSLLTSPASMGASGRILSFNVINGNSYRVQTSTNLTAWSTVGSFYANGTNASYLDAAASSFPNRFYRLASP